jgi:hypothetical protein
MLRAGSRSSAPPTALKGRTEPRLWTPPLRRLTRKTSRGYEIADFAEMIGEPLLPWQRWAVIHAMELLPDGTYRFRTVLILVARQNGKSHLKRVVSLWRLYVDGARAILGTAQDVSRAREQWNLAQATIAASPDLAAEYDPPRIGKLRNVNGDEWFRLDGGGRYIISASNGKAARGGSYDEATIDELREQHDWKAWSAVSKTTSARRKGQLWAMSNEGDDDSVVLHQLYDNGIAGTEPSLGVFAWTAPDDCALDDTAAWCQANPGLGYVLSEAAVRSACGTDPAPVFRTEVLCQRVDQLDGAIDYGAWTDCADPQGNLDNYRKRIAAGFDIAPDGQHATLVAAAITEDGRLRIETAGAWTSAKDAMAGLPDLLTRIKPVALGWYPTGPGAEFAPILRVLAGNQELTGMEAATACMGLSGLVKARQVIQPNDPLLNSHIKAARKLNAADGFRFTRRGPVGHVDGAYAAAAAIHVARTMPAVRKPRIRVVG